MNNRDGEKELFNLRDSDPFGPGKTFLQGTPDRAKQKCAALLQQGVISPDQEIVIVHEHTRCDWFNKRGPYCNCNVLILTEDPAGEMTTDYDNKRYRQLA